MILVVLSNPLTIDSRDESESTASLSAGAIGSTALTTTATAESAGAADDTGNATSSTIPDNNTHLGTNLVSIGLASTNASSIYPAFASTLDVVRIVGETGFATFADVQAHASQVDSDLHIHLNGADAATIANMTIAQFQSSDFLFA